MQLDHENASDTPDESRFQDLLLVWLDSCERGEEIALEGLVSPHDSPAVLAKLQQWTADLREFDSRFVTRDSVKTCSRKCSTLISIPLS